MVTERSHPASEAGGSGWEELPHMQGEVAAWVQEGLEELSHVQGQGQRPRGATPRPRSGAAAERSNLMSEERRLRGSRTAERSYSTFKVITGDLIQGKEQ